MKSLEYLATRNAGRFDIVEKDGPRPCSGSRWTTERPAS